MRIKFTYQRTTGDPVDLVAELDASATVGQLAAHLAHADPCRSESDLRDPHTLVILGDVGRVLGLDEIVAETSLTSGVRVSLAPARSSGESMRRPEDAAVKLKVLAGPDKGQEFLLPVGAAVVGRGRSCDIRLMDPMVSRRHARVTVGDTIEVIDLASANGVTVGSETTPRASISTGDVVIVGDTQLSVTQLQRTWRGAGTIEFIRSARIDRTYEGREFEAPEPPERKHGSRFPTVALILPLLMGGVLFLTTHRLASIIFVALSPLMLIGNAIESRISNRRVFKREVQEFRTDLSALVEDVEAEQKREIEGRLQEHPSAHECAAAASARSDLLWSRRRDLPRFGHVRLGLGSLPTRSTVELPRRSRAPYELVREVEEAVVGAAEVTGVPVVADLADGALGVAGPRAALLDVARSLVVQITALHSPADMAVAAVLRSEAASDWDWLKWLPHTSTPHSPVEVRHLTTTQSDALQLVSSLEGLLEARAADNPDDAVRVLLVVESGSGLEHSRLVELAEQGPALGLHVIWLAPTRQQLPASCKAFIETSLDATGAKVSYVETGDERTPVIAETLDVGAAWSVGYALAPVHDSSARSQDDSDLPRSISQFATLQDTSLGSRPESVIEHWVASNSVLTGSYAPATPVKKASSLRAIVGMSATGVHAVDLRSDGPHALVGGTTNSGKSELLQAWILSMATLHSPERVTFLLVDYKGGSAFADCTKLPHTIGLVTDLSPHMVRRALTSLGAELTYREELLHRYDAKDLIELEKHGVVGAPPSLVIVVDEFAALVNEVPEFVEGMVNVAQRGRSLGLHLILATQQPSGVIKGSLRANTNLRIALRMADEADSTDVLGSAEAAAFDQDVPGRAMSRSGPKRLVAFQTAYAGGWTSDKPDPPSLYVEELSLTSPIVWELPDEGDAAPKDRDQTDIKRLVASIGEASKIAGLPTPRKAWLPVLPMAVDLSTLAAPRQDDELVIALGDDPERQRQPAVAFRPDREGNLSVYGTGGAGKSGVLRAVAIGAGFAQRKGPCHVYGLDFGLRALQMLEKLPHVGSIIPGGDPERVGRLISWLRQTVDERAVRYAAVEAGTITEYRQRATRPLEPRIIVLVDNVGAFRAANESSDRIRFVDMLTAIASEGRPVGVHVVLSAGDRTAIHTNLSSTVQRRLIMRLASAEDYSLLGAPADVLTSTSPPGRALDGDREIQIGILGTSGDDASQAARLEALASALRAAGVADAPPILSLPTTIDLNDLTASRQEVTVGLDSATLLPVGVDARGAFLITGPPTSGRSTALRTISASARMRFPEAEMHYFGSRRSSLNQSPVWTSVAVTVDEVAARAQELAARVAERQDDAARVMVFVESASDFMMSAAESALQALVKACVAEDQWFVAEGEVSSVKSTAGYVGLVKSSRRGLALQPDQETGAGLFNTAFPRVNRGEFPEGRGFLVGSGRAAVVQIARSGHG